MKILFSPSEAKHTGGSASFIKDDSFLFPSLFDKRLEILTAYNSFVLTATNEKLIKLFGTKKQTVVDYYHDDLMKRKTMKVIERYDGVAYDYLDYPTLDDSQKLYIDKNVIIFSNLFGPLLAGDATLPDYKLKQGEKIGDIAPEKFYNEHFSTALDTLLHQEHYLDLRAGFYNKFYKPSSAYTTLKFIKEGKVVSHWAKAYRGLVLRELATNGIETIEDFMRMNIKNLEIKEIIEKGIQTEIIYNISH